MALTNNPNKTKGLERRWNKEITRRFRDLLRGMLAIPLNSVVTNVDAIEQFQIDNFVQQFDALNFLLIMSEPWQNKYQEEAYTRSIDSANAEIKRQSTAAEINQITLLTSEGPVVATLTRHRNELDFLKTRANDSLRKWSTQMSAEIKTILHENIGKMSTEEINELMAKRIGVASSRSRTIAATELAQAAQRARINQADELQETIGAPVNVRWVTVNDSKVRHRHATWHGKIFTQQQAANNINVSPWNCRCGLRISIQGKESVNVAARFARERKALLAQEERATAQA